MKLSYSVNKNLKEQRIFAVLFVCNFRDTKTIFVQMGTLKNNANFANYFGKIYCK